MLFREIIGQEQVKQTLRKAVDENHLPHALLLSGREGTGKLALALALTQYLLCEHRHDGEPCNECPSCLQIRKMGHPDLHFAFPIARSKESETCDSFLPKWREQLTESPYFSLGQWGERLSAENKQLTIYTNESDEIIKKLSRKSFEGGYKCLIIWMPERMQVACANKLLKMIEEPFDQTLILLISENPDALLDTIRSRTQRIFVPPLQQQEITNALVTQHHLSADEAARLAHIANGNLIKAIDMVETSAETHERFNLFVRIMRATYSRNIKEMHEWTTAVTAIGRKKQVEFLAYAQRLIRESFIHNLKQSELNYMTTDEENFVAKFAPFIKEVNVFGILSELELAEQHIERNVQAKIVFFDLSMKLTMLLKK